MPGSLATTPVTPTWMPFSWFASAKKPEPNQPIVKAPIA